MTESVGEHSCAISSAEVPPEPVYSAELGDDIQLHDPMSIPAPPETMTNAPLEATLGPGPSPFAADISAKLEKRSENLGDLQARVIEGASQSILTAQDAIILSTNDQVAKAEEEIFAWREWEQTRKTDIGTWHELIRHNIVSSSTSHIDWLEENAERISSLTRSIHSQAVGDLSNELDDVILPAIDREVMRLTKDVDDAVDFVRTALGEDLPQAELARVLDWRSKKNNQV